MRHLSPPLFSRLVAVLVSCCDAAADVSLGLVGLQDLLYLQV